MSDKLSSDATNATAPVGGNGRKPSGDHKIRVAIVGVGNCASSLVQGRYYYENASETDFVPGLMHVNLGGYHVRDIEFVAAIDIDKNKVGKDLSEAVFTKPNNTVKFSDVPNKGVTVARGMTHDGLGKYLSQIIEKAPGPTADIVGILKDTKTDVVINYLPVGSEEATKWYVEQVLAAGCALINCIVLSRWTPRSRKSVVSTRCVIVAPTCDLISSPITGRPFFSKRLRQYFSRAIKTGIQLTNPQPASRICSTYHLVASSEPTGR